MLPSWWVSGSAGVERPIQTLVLGVASARRAVGCPMAPQQGIVLGLVLCLAQLCSGAYEEFQTLPSISVQPGPKVLLGESVTIVCKGPDWVTSFRVQKTHREDGTIETEKRCHSRDLNCGPPDQTRMNCHYMDQNNVSEDGLHKTKAQFLIQAVCEDSAGSYKCLYYRGSDWSVSSEPLKLEVTSKNNSDPKSGRGERVTPTSALSSQPLPCTSSTVLSTRSEQDSVSPSKNEDKPTPWVYIIIGISVTVVVLLLLLLLLLVRLLQRRREHGSTNGKLKKQRPQDRVTPAAEVHTGTPEPLATLPSPAAADGPPLLGVAGSPMTAAAEAPAEVTYAQLNPNSLLHAAPTQPERGTESCTYASVVRH